VLQCAAVCFSDVHQTAIHAALAGALLTMLCICTSICICKYMYMYMYMYECLDVYMLQCVAVFYTVLQ